MQDLVALEGDTLPDQEQRRRCSRASEKREATLEGLHLHQLVSQAVVALADIQAMVEITG